MWNSHRGRKQQDKQLHCGIPDHIYYHPDQYGAERCGYRVSGEHLKEVLEENDDYLELEIKL